MQSTFDRESWERWRHERDGEAFRAIVHRYGAMVLHTCTRVLRNRADAEEVAQECFEILASSSSLPGTCSLGAWLHGVATKRALMRLRTDRRRVARDTVYACEHPDSVEQTWDDIYDYVDEAIASLPDELRTPIVLHFMDGASHRAVGRSLGIPHRTVGDRIHRGMQRVRARLQREGIVVSSAVLLAALQDIAVHGVNVPASEGPGHARWTGDQDAPLRVLVGMSWLKPVAVVFVLAVIALMTVQRRDDRAGSKPVAAQVSTHAQQELPMTRRDQPGSTETMAAVPLWDAHPLRASSDVSGGLLGWAAVSIDDMSGDGFPEIMVSAPRWGPGGGFGETGVVVVLDGATGQTAGVLESPSPELACGEYDCDGQGRFGVSLARLQDINGNGASEVVVGAPSEAVASYRNAGHVYVFDSETHELLHTFITPNLQNYAVFGTALEALPDVTGDGIDEIIVAAEQESPQGFNAAGRVYVVDAVSKTFLHTLEPPDVGQCHTFGTTVSSVPDVDGDGHADVVVGQGSAGVGGAHLFSGATGALLRSYRGPGDLPGFGIRVLGVPDQDSDGAGDLLVTHTIPARVAPDSFATVYLLSGVSGTVLNEFSVPVGNPCRKLGITLTYHPDVSGDGVPDFLIGMESEDCVRKTPEAVFAYSGVDGALLGELHNPTQTRSSSGFGSRVVLAVPDVNQDGLDEVLVTSNIAGDAHLFVSPVFDLATTSLTNKHARALSSGHALRAPFEDRVARGEPDIAQGDAPARIDSVWSRAVRYARRAADRLFSNNTAPSAARSDEAGTEAAGDFVERAADIMGCRPRQMPQ